MKILSKILNWYFSKKTLPYWCLILLDSAIVLFSGLFTYWVFHRSSFMFDHRFEVLYTCLLYVAVSWIGARVFRTYLGIVRFSSFVDLQKVAYANLLSMTIAVVLSLILEYYQVSALTGLNQTETVITFVIATLLMWAVRVHLRHRHPPDVGRPSSCKKHS